MTSTNALIVQAIATPMQLAPLGSHEEEAASSQNQRVTICSALVPDLFTGE